MIYAHVLNQSGGRGVRSPLDAITIRDKPRRISAGADKPAAASSEGSATSTDHDMDPFGDYEGEG